MPFGSQNSAGATHVPVPLSSFAIRVMLAVAWLVEKASRAYFFPRHYENESIAMPMVNALDTEKKRKLPEKRQQQKMGMQKIYD